MLDQQTRVCDGMNWVAERLSALSQGQGAEVEALGWSPDETEDCQSTRRLQVRLNGKRRVASFDDDELEALPVNTRVQTSIDADLRAFLNDGLRGAPLRG